MGTLGCPISEVAKMSTQLNIELLSEWIDNYNRHKAPELQLWERTAKVGEEAGEVMEAMIGLSDQNPRKGATHDREDVSYELLDVAVTALGAWYHMHPAGNMMLALETHAQHLVDRAGL